MLHVYVYLSAKKPNNEKKSSYKIKDEIKNNSRFHFCPYLNLLFTANKSSHHTNMSKILQLSLQIVSITVIWCLNELKIALIHNHLNALYN